MLLNSHQAHQILVEDLFLEGANQLEECDISVLGLELPLYSFHLGVDLPERDCLGNRHPTLCLSHDIKLSEALFVLHQQECLPVA